MKKYVSKNSDYQYAPIKTEDILKATGGAGVKNSVKGFSFFKDDELVHVSGIEYNGVYFKVFSHSVLGVDVPKITVWRATKIVMSMINNLKCDVYAERDENIERADLFLERLGFKYTDGIYKRSYRK